jgi:hypothetical protein
MTAMDADPSKEVRMGEERDRLEPEGGRERFEPEKQHPDVEGHKQHPVSDESDSGEEEGEESGADVEAHKQHPKQHP